ncbi:hypothetical protein [Dipodfec virus RodF1_47]|uniref:Uncharacterized protein n=1 Tax=Dipodfec virus RodF1_47 TaxID=2929298 RepID=A0A976N2E9_9VIRU|nr:hypothetical protein [Dipodfec virus RodF1_47]
MQENITESKTQKINLPYFELYDCVLRDYRNALSRCIVNYTENLSAQEKGDNINEYFKTLHLQTYLVQQLQGLDNFIQNYSEMSVPIDSEKF